MIGAALATVVCVVALGLVLDAERQGSRRRRYLWKPLASAGFVLVPVCTGVLWSDAGPGLDAARWIAVGLVLGAAGDVALMFESDRGFLAGLAAFLLGHVAYVIGFAQLVPIDAWYGGVMTVAAVAAMVGAGTILGLLWPRLGSMKVPVIAYVGVITTMLIGGAAMTLRDPAVSASSRGLLI